MASNNPRDFREWMRSVERQLREAHRNGMTTAQFVRQELGDRIDQDFSRQPTAPVELSWETALYLDVQRRGRARLVGDFPDVTKATDGTDIIATSYELWGYDDSAPLLTDTTSAYPGLMAPASSFPGGKVEGLAAVPPKTAHLIATSTTSSFRVDGFIPGSVWRLSVRAIGAGLAVAGQFSETTIVYMGEDNTPPPMPTAPVLTVARGTISARWDGMAVTGPMPADFKYAVLAHGTSSSPTTEVARFGRDGGFWVLADIDYYDPQFFRMAAVDESGNMGPWSEQAVGYTTPLVDKDVILSTIDAAKTHLINVDAGVSILPNTVITEHLVVTEDMTAAIANFLYIGADKIDVNSLAADEIFTGLLDAVIVRADMFEGKQFTGGEFIGPIFRTGVEEFAGVRLDTTGLRAWSPAGVQTFSVDAATGKVNTVGRFSTGSGASPFALIIPSEDSFNGKQVAMLMARNSTAMSGTDSGGMWVVDGTLATPQQLNIRGLNGGGVTVWNNLTVSNISSTPQITISSSQDVRLDAGAGNTVNLLNNGAAYAMTSSAPANVYMHSTGQLFKSTSSLRYKTDVKDWSPEYRALDLVPKSWVDREPVDADDPYHRYYGLIAEQVAQVMPELAVYNDAGEPEAVQYERVAVALIPIIADLVRRVGALEA